MVWHYQMGSSNNITKWHYRMASSNGITEWHLQMTSSNSIVNGHRQRALSLSYCIEKWYSQIWHQMASLNCINQWYHLMSSSDGIAKWHCQWLARVGIELRQACWIANWIVFFILCYPAYCITNCIAYFVMYCID